MFSDLSMSHDIDGIDVSLRGAHPLVREAEGILYPKQRNTPVFARVYFVGLSRRRRSPSSGMVSREKHRSMRDSFAQLVSGSTRLT